MSDTENLPNEDIPFEIFEKPVKQNNKIVYSNIKNKETLPPDTFDNATKIQLLQQQEAALRKLESFTKNSAYLKYVQTTFNPKTISAWENDYYDQFIDYTMDAYVDDINQGEIRQEDEDLKNYIKELTHKQIALLKLKHNKHILMTTPYGSKRNVNFGLQNMISDVKDYNKWQNANAMIGMDANEELIKKRSAKIELFISLLEKKKAHEEMLKFQKETEKELERARIKAEKNAEAEKKKEEKAKTKKEEEEEKKRQQAAEKQKNEEEDEFKFIDLVALPFYPLAKLHDLVAHPLKNYDTIVNLGLGATTVAFYVNQMSALPVDKMYQFNLNKAIETVSSLGAQALTSPAETWGGIMYTFQLLGGTIYLINSLHRVQNSSTISEWINKIKSPIRKLAENKKNPASSTIKTGLNVIDYVVTPIMQYVWRKKMVAVAAAVAIRYSRQINNTLIDNQILEIVQRIERETPQQLDNVIHGTNGAGGLQPDEPSRDAKSVVGSPSNTYYFDYSTMNTTNPQTQRVAHDSLFKNTFITPGFEDFVQLEETQVFFSKPDEVEKFTQDLKSKSLTVINEFETLINNMHVNDPYNTYAQNELTTKVVDAIVRNSTETIFGTGSEFNHAYNDYYLTLRDMTGQIFNSPIVIQNTQQSLNLSSTFYEVNSPALYLTLNLKSWQNFQNDINQIINGWVVEMDIDQTTKVVENWGGDPNFAAVMLKTLQYTVQYENTIQSLQHEVESQIAGQAMNVPASAYKTYATVRDRHLAQWVVPIIGYVKDYADSVIKQNEDRDYLRAKMYNFYDDLRIICLNQRVIKDGTAIKLAASSEALNIRVKSDFQNIKKHVLNSFLNMYVLWPNLITTLYQEGLLNDNEYEIFINYRPYILKYLAKFRSNLKITTLDSLADSVSESQFITFLSLVHEDKIIVRLYDKMYASTWVKHFESNKHAYAFGGVSFLMSLFSTMTAAAMPPAMELFYLYNPAGRRLPPVPPL